MKIAVLFRDTNDLSNAASCERGKKYDPRLDWEKLEHTRTEKPTSRGTCRKDGIRSFRSTAFSILLSIQENPQQLSPQQSVSPKVSQEDLLEEGFFFFPAIHKIYPCTNGYA